MIKLIMLKGLPGSGKSTWAKENVIVQNGYPSTIRVNRDLLREMLHGGRWNKAAEKITMSARNAFIGFALSNGLNVIVDDTNLVPFHEADLRNIASKFNAEFEVKDFTHVTPEVCIERDKNREAKVGADVIMGMYEEYLR